MKTPAHFPIQLAVCGFLAVAVLVVFGRSLRNDFVNYDDNDYVYRNAHVSAGLTWEGLKWAVVSNCAANWHPLAWMSHMLDCQLYGQWAAGHHLTNLLLHAATAILLFLVLQRMTGALWPSACVAALFAIHPLRVESVAWVAERKDLLCGLFFVLLLAAYTAYAARPSWWRYALVLAMYGLGLLSKPMLVTVPLLLLLLDYWPLRRWGRGAWLFWEKIPLLALAAGSATMTLRAQAQVAAIKGLAELPWSWRAGNALLSYVVYIKQMFYPLGLAVYYPHPARTITAWQTVGAALILLAISAAAVALVRSRPYLIVGWLWYLGMLVPVIGLVQVGAQAHADRYTYLPQIGLYLMLAWGAADLPLPNSWRRPLLASLAALVMVALMGCAWVQTGYWRDSETLWRHALDCTDRNDVAYNNLGLLQHDANKIDEAIACYCRAVEINPAYFLAWNNLGLNLLSQGKTAEAIDCFQNALTANPNYAESHNNLAVVLNRLGKEDEALAHLQAALAADPQHALARQNLDALLRARAHRH
jgi:tetratricopeptide (TPR) repeat protein